MEFPEIVRRIRQAGLTTQRPRPALRAREADLPDLAERVRLIERFYAHLQQSKTPGMLFFVMYDIEDHKVRRHLAKYLRKQGCVRMQKSVFLGRVSLNTYQEISGTLREINALYENGDSILILPVSRENMGQLNVIGKDLDYRMTVAPPKVMII